MPWRAGNNNGERLVHFRLLRQPSKPNTPKPLANSGSAAGMGVVRLASITNSVTTKFPFANCPGPSLGSAGFFNTSRNMPVTGDAASINAEIANVSVPAGLCVNSSFGDNEENVVPFNDNAFWIKTGVFALDKLGDVSVV